MQLPSDPPNCVEEHLDYVDAQHAQHELTEHDDHPVAVNLYSVDQLGNHGASPSGVAIPQSLMEQIERCDKADAGVLVEDVIDDENNNHNDDLDAQPGDGDGGEVLPGDGDGGEEPEATHDEDRKGETHKYISISII